MWDLRLAMLEGRFSRTINTSRKPVMDFLSDMLVGSPHGHCYEGFGDAGALYRCLQSLGRRQKLRWLYLLAHGSRQAILAGDGSRLPVEAIAGALDGESFEGAFFGSCRFLTQANARRLLLQRETTLRWVGGYNREFDWVHGASIELYFWYWFLHGQYGVDAVEHLEACVAQVHAFMPGAHAEDGLQFYVRESNGVRPLLGVKHQADLGLAAPSTRAPHVWPPLIFPTEEPGDPEPVDPEHVSPERGM